MNVAWIYPVERRCGISIYSRMYTEALQRYANVKSYDIDALSKDTAAVARINAAGLAHIQYEPSFFRLGLWRDSYKVLCGKIKVPLVVTVHEVYQTVPWAYPREKVGGPSVIRAVKLFAYDVRHPLITASQRHARERYLASRIVVHHAYHRDILARKCGDPVSIDVLPVPVPRIGDLPEDRLPQDVPRLGSAGFITPAYDFPLLMDSLAALDGDWRFVWIGGTRRPEDAPVEQWLHDEIRRRGWAGRFTVSGWVDEQVRDRLLRELDLYLALYRSRSSSASLTLALGARLPVVAVAMPMTSEIAAAAGCLLTVAPQPDQVAGVVHRLCTDAKLRSEVRTAADRYAREHSFECMAGRLFDIYRKVCE